MSDSLERQLGEIVSKVENDQGNKNLRRLVLEFSTLDTETIFNLNYIKIRNVVFMLSPDERFGYDVVEEYCYSNSGKIAILWIPSQLGMALVDTIALRCEEVQGIEQVRLFPTYPRPLYPTTIRELIDKIGNEIRRNTDKIYAIVIESDKLVPLVCSLWNIPLPKRLPRTPQNDDASGEDTSGDPPRARKNIDDDSGGGAKNKRPQTPNKPGGRRRRRHRKSRR